MANKYPYPAFSFIVDWGGKSVSFSEVSGLTQEKQPIEFRWGDSPDYSTIKMPGMAKFSNITLKRGICAADNQFFEWLQEIKMNQVTRRDLTIKLLNEKRDPVVTWKVQNAFPVKLEGPALKANGNEIAIESIELAHEGVTVENS